jgi:CDP-4-dehydro-6-deoxyglucose reductase, E3
MPVIITSSGRKFTGAEGETLLDAALRADVALAYSCKSGRCGTCKSQVHSGSTAATHEELALTEAERADGWILSCVRTATSDVCLSADDLGNVKLIPARTLPCRIHSLDRLSDDVNKVVLRLPPSTVFSYHPGQYIEVIGTGGVRRSYSIANAQGQCNLIELHIRAVAGGVMSGYWFDRARPNDLLRMTGPFGTFFLRDVAGQDVVFLATGTGIAPVKAMLEGLANTPRELKPRSIAVYWGGRSPSDFYWDPATIQLGGRFVPVLSRANAEWVGAKGYVQQAMMADAPALMQTAVYACGSEVMINSARELLLAAGLPKRRFSSDAFVCSEAN